MSAKELWDLSHDSFALILYIRLFSHDMTPFEGREGGKMETGNGINHFENRNGIFLL